LARRGLARSGEEQLSRLVAGRGARHDPLLFEHQDELDAFFRDADALGEQLRAAAEAQHADIYAEIRSRIARYSAADSGMVADACMTLRYPLCPPQGAAAPPGSARP